LAASRIASPHRRASQKIKVAPGRRAFFTWKNREAAKCVFLLHAAAALKSHQRSAVPTDGNHPKIIPASSKYLRRRKQMALAPVGGEKRGRKIEGEIQNMSCI